MKAKQFYFLNQNQIKFEKNSSILFFYGRFTKCIKSNCYRIKLLYFLESKNHL